MPALKYIHHVCLFKSHYFDFHVLTCIPWDPVAKSPEPISLFSFSSTSSFHKHLKGQLHRLAVVEGVGLAASKISVECNWGEEKQERLDEGVGSSRRRVSEQGRVPPHSLPFSRPAPDL